MLAIKSRGREARDGRKWTEFENISEITPRNLLTVSEGQGEEYKRVEIQDREIRLRVTKWTKKKISWFGEGERASVCLEHLSFFLTYCPERARADDTDLTLDLVLWVCVALICVSVWTLSCWRAGNGIVYLFLVSAPNAVKHDIGTQQCSLLRRWVT